MKKIAIMHYSYLPVIAGVELLIRDQAEFLSNQGFRVKIITGIGKKTNQKIDVDIIPELNSQNPNYLKMREIFDQGKIPASFENYVKRVVLKIKKAIRDVDICIIHQALTMHFNFLFTEALHRIIKENNTIKFISWTHDATFLDQNYLKKYQSYRNSYPYNLLCKKWPKVKYIVISKARQEKIAELFRVKKEELTVIPNSINLVSFWKLDEGIKKLFLEERLYESELVAVLPMRIVRRKNIEQALEIIAAIKKSVPKIKYIITAPLDFQNPDIKEYFQRLKDLRKKLNIEKEVIFLSDYKFKDGQKIDLEKLEPRQLYALADFLLVPSRLEGFGMVILEAAAARVPIVCSNIKPFLEIAKNLVLSFDLKENPKITAQRILKFLEKNKSAKLYRRVLNNYNMYKIYQEKIKPILK